MQTPKQKKPYPQFMKELNSQISYYQSLSNMKDGQKKLDEIKKLNTDIQSSNDGGKIAQKLSEQMSLLGELILNDRKQQFVLEK